ncbi:unnamed protein product [Fusarium graminearum]|uniref:Chromosome 3, complete genome n=2 Tax=Gibberella zeae TaxID=5518 RepID=A0A0E0SQB8_GIBZE|nr:hypothetical protein FG05_30221 [Fusarium graminearum]CAF3463265.1 unnamed protein product [Fusarium graminearum]CAF3533815.1 unnamed protein product [Fusarium graminearum]CAG1982249.1 unnamed protein product [Fusarium graminearum]CAG1982769.1 unnamed protein product [Fusarium graminearum]
MEGVRRCVSTTAPASKSPPISLQTAGAGAGTFRSIPPSLQHLTYRKLQHSSHPSTLANPHPDGQRRRNSDPWYRYRT